ncbi:MAG: phospholipid carrier-dependent glycosyltransferase [Thiomonas sp. 13-64-67]|nr:MAG: phospholipid carrier-dependent glycosyltransferase [Thiomonas sp. 13-64-67]
MRHSTSLHCSTPQAAATTAHKPGWIAARADAQWRTSLLVDGLVLLIAAASLFWRLGAAPIRDTNEALYASIALAMAHGGSWIIPHLDGVPYIEKPPLLYWLMALSFKAFGAGAWQARLPDALAAWLTVLGCIVLGRTVSAPLAGRFAALVTGTALGYVLIARNILFDPLMVFFWLAALALLVLAVERRQRVWLRAAAVAVALATLTKGPEALLLLGLVALVQLLAAPGAWKRRELLKFYLDPWAIALFVLVAAPWHLAALRILPGFGWFFFVNETIGRFLGTRIPDDFHHGPWWYYGAVLAAFAPRLHGDDTATASARWTRNTAIILTVFFSSASDKGAYYLLPVVPLVAWWLGVRLQAALCAGDDSAALQRRLGLGALLFGMAALGLWALTFTPPLHAELLRSGLPAAQFGWLPALVIGVALAAFIGGALLWSRRLALGLAVFSLSAVIMVDFSAQLAVAKTAEISQKQVAEVMHRLLPADTVWFSWQTFEDHDASLLFYGVPHLFVIDSTSEDLWFGCRDDRRQNTCVNENALLKARAEGKPVAIWVSRKRLQSWQASGLAHGLHSQPFKDSVVFYSRGAKR